MMYERYCGEHGHPVRGGPIEKTGWDEHSAHLFSELDLPNLENAAAVITWATNIGRAVLTQQVSRTQAGIAAYLLQIVSMNFDRLHQELRALEPIGKDVPEGTPNDEDPLAYEPANLLERKRVARAVRSVNQLAAGGS